MAIQLEGVQILIRAEADAAFGNDINRRAVENARAPFELAHVLGNREGARGTVRCGVNDAGNLGCVLIGLERFSQFKNGRVIQGAGTRCLILCRHFAEQGTAVVKHFTTIGGDHGQADLADLLGCRNVHGTDAASHGGWGKSRRALLRLTNRRQAEECGKNGDGQSCVHFIFLVIGVSAKWRLPEVGCACEYIARSMQTDCKFGVVFTFAASLVCHPQLYLPNDTVWIELDNQPTCKVARLLICSLFSSPIEILFSVCITPPEA